MTKKILVVLVGILLFSCNKQEQVQEEQIPEIAQGYGAVKWGDSVETVRAAYQIAAEVEAQADKDDPNLITLQQDKVSEAIEMRRFRFIEDKLYEVEVQYPRKISYKDLYDTLREKYGRAGDTRFIGIGINNNAISFDTGIYWDKYYPHLTVSLEVYDAHRYFHKVTYRWAEFKETYDFAKLNRVEL